MNIDEIPKLIRERMVIDEMIFGNAFCLKNADGTFERIDPMKVILKSDGTFEVGNMED